MLNDIFNKIFVFLKNYFVIISLVFIFVLSSYSVFHKSFFHVHDFTHAARIAEMSAAFDNGQFPVRWSSNLGYGFGMPLFNFYAPLPYFIGAIVLKLGMSAVGSIKFLYLFINFVTLIGSYLLGKKISGRWAGLLIAAAYTLAPYRAVNLFVRGALSEAFAMAFLPLVLFAILAFIKKQDKKYLLLLLISLVAIILSHNLTALIFIPMVALFTFVYLLYQKKNKLLLIIAAQFLLAAALTAFYILPAFIEKDGTIISSIFSGYFHYSHHFLYIRQFFQDKWQYGGSAWGPDDQISFFLGKGQLLALFSLIFMFGIKAIKNIKQLFKNNYFVLVLLFSFFAVLSLFMSTMKSQFIWDKIQIIQFIQFPWRFLSTAAFFISIILGISAYFIDGKSRTIYGILILSVLFFNATYFKPEKYLDDAEALYYTDAKKIQLQMSETLPDYIPKQMAKQTILLERTQKLDQVWIADKENLKSLSLMFDHGFEKMALVGLKNEDVLNFKVAYFPGWQAEVDGVKTEISINKELGNIQVLVPAGEHKVGIYFSENTPARKLGDILSIIALIIVFYFFYPFSKKKK